MAHVVVLGAGLGGVVMAYEMKDQLRPGDKLTVVTKDAKYHFVPSNPWIPVRWRQREDIQIDLAPTFADIARRKTEKKPLAAFLAEPHGKMPDMSLTRAEIDDIVAYIRSLGAPGSEPAEPRKPPELPKNG